MPFATNCSAGRSSRGRGFLHTKFPQWEVWQITFVGAGARAEPPKSRGLFAGGRVGYLAIRLALTRPGQFLASFVPRQTQFPAFFACAAVRCLRFSPILV
jgi:hypothetical protein